MQVERHWYRVSALSLLLAPLSWLYCAIVAVRRWAYGAGLLPVTKLDLPVVVVGNITVGGTGKTPLVIWVVELLRGAGWTPAIVSRGYGGDTRQPGQLVFADSDPAQVGDEPVLLAQRCGCPVCVDSDRVRAARTLATQHACDIIVSDDGLQHLALGRDVEIVVIDSARRFGNGRCLPAGPLREPVRRLEDVDFIVANGSPARLEFGMRLQGDRAVSLRQKDDSRALTEFASGPVHAVAGIGNPKRFFTHLRRFGLQLIEHEYPDHHRFSPEDLEFGDTLPILMTEKDAVKCAAFAQSRCWHVPVNAVLDPNFGTRLLELLDLRATTVRGSVNEPPATHVEPE